MWLASSLNSSAVIVAGSNGANGTNSSPEQLRQIASGFNYENNVIAIEGGAGVYLGPGTKGDTGYVLTADHLKELTIGSSITIAGENHKVISRSQINTSDLSLYEIGKSRVGKLPDLPTVTIASTHPSINDQILMTGRGTRVQGTDNNSRTSDMINKGGYDVYEWGPASKTISFGLNNVAGDIPWAMGNATAEWTNSLGYKGSEFYIRFDDPGAGNYTTSWEGMASRGDSGAPVFIKRNGIWELSGITSVALSNGNQPKDTSGFKNAASFSNLAEYHSDISKYGNFTLVPEPSTTFLVATGATAALIRRKRKQIPPK